MAISTLTCSVKLRRGALAFLLVANCARQLCGLPIWVPTWAFTIRIHDHAH